MNFSMLTTKPTEDGYYWMQSYNPVTGIGDGRPEIVYVAFDYSFRKKKVSRVIAHHWSANLEDVNNHFWSEKIVCPFSS